jgi:hypothetical protein
MRFQVLLLVSTVLLAALLFAGSVALRGHALPLAGDPGTQEIERGLRALEREVSVLRARLASLPMSADNSGRP